MDRGGQALEGGSCVPLTPTSPRSVVFLSTLTSTHSRPTEPTELWESKATQGIYGNLKILTSAVVRYTRYSATHSGRPPPTFYFHCALGPLLLPLKGFPTPESCLPLFNLSSTLNLFPLSKRIFFLMENISGIKRGRAADDFVDTSVVLD